MNSLVTDFLAGTAGFGRSGAGADAPSVMRSSAEWTSLISVGMSPAGTELLVT